MTTPKAPHAAILVKALPSHQPGGLEFHACDLARGLTEQGWRVSLLTTRAAETPAVETDLSGIDIQYARTGPPGRYSRAWFRELPRMLTELHRRDPIDVIHAQEWAAFNLVRPSPAIPLVSTIHGTLDSETPLAPVIYKRGSAFERMCWFWQYKHRLLMRGTYQRLLHDSDRLIVDSRFTRGELLAEQVPEQNITVVPLGLPEAHAEKISDAEIQRRTGMDRPYVLTVSRLTWIKGVDLGIQAMARGRVALEYVVIGNGPEKQRLEKIAGQYPRLKIRFLSNVCSSDLRAWYAGARLVLMPERNQPAFGLVALEANLQGTPVLAARTGALPEVIGDDGGWFFERGNVTECAGTLLGLLANPKALHDQGCKARQSALRRFSLQQMARQTAEVYRSCLQCQHDHS